MSGRGKCLEGEYVRGEMSYTPLHYLAKLRCGQFDFQQVTDGVRGRVKIRKNESDIRRSYLRYIEKLHTVYLKLYKPKL